MMRDRLTNSQLSRVRVAPLQRRKGVLARIDESYVRNARPSYTPKVAKRICLSIASGMSLKKTCEDPKMPSTASVSRWLMDPDKTAFHTMYRQARRIQAEMKVDEIFDIADDDRSDYIKTVDKDGNVVEKRVDHEHIARSRVRIDTRKWFAGKLIKEVYGDHSQVDLGVTNDLQKLLTQSSNTSADLPSARGNTYDHE